MYLKNKQQMKSTNKNSKFLIKTSSVPTKSRNCNTGDQQPVGYRSDAD